MIARGSLNANERALAWRLNWYRQSELEGSLLLGRMIRQATDPYLVEQLTRHCMDEARHSWLWEQAIRKSGLGVVRIQRPMQAFYLEAGAMPTSLLEVLSLTHIFEQRVEQQFELELQCDRLPPVVAKTFHIMIRDEQQHLDWIRSWLLEQAGSEKVLQQYREIDRKVVSQLAPFHDCLWKVDGLGIEVEKE